MRDIPRGVKALLYQEAALKDKIERVALSLFEEWGFQRVETPTTEFLGELAKGLDAESLRRVITFTDPAGGGKPLALRSDVTPQIARLAATSLAKWPMPLRLCYAQTVYRSLPSGASGRMEVYQAGVELIGLGSPEADAEMIAIATEALRRLGFGEVKMAVSHVGYARELINSLDLSEEHEASVKRALVRKDVKELTDALNMADCSGKTRAALENLPALFGGRDILEKADAINDNAEACLKDLKDVLAILDEYGYADSVVIDLGEIRGFGYYTGVTFEGFIKGIGKSVLSGGRYDRLLKAYGIDRPATGFAIDVDRILDHLYRAGEPKGWSAADALVVGANGSFMEAAGLARRMREKGFRVARDIIRRPLEESVDYARRMKIGAVVIMGLSETRENTVKVINTETDQEASVSIEEILSGTHFGR